MFTPETIDTLWLSGAGKKGFDAPGSFGPGLVEVSGPVGLFGSVGLLGPSGLTGSAGSVGSPGLDGGSVATTLPSSEPPQAGNTVAKNNKRVTPNIFIIFIP